MKKKPIDGKLTVIKPRRQARKRTQEPQGSAEIIGEAIEAIHRAVDAGKRLREVYKKLRGK